MLTVNAWITLTTHAATLPHASFSKLLAGWRTLSAHAAWGQPPLASPHRHLHEALVRASLGSPVARAPSWPRGRQPPTTPQPWTTAGMPSRRRCSHCRRQDGHLYWAARHVEGQPSADHHILHTCNVVRMSTDIYIYILVLSIYTHIIRVYMK